MVTDFGMLFNRNDPHTRVSTHEYRPTVGRQKAYDRTTRWANLANHARVLAEMPPP
jgi:hypothetical protein